MVLMGLRCGVWDVLVALLFWIAAKRKLALYRKPVGKDFFMLTYPTYVTASRHICEILKLSVAGCSKVDGVN